MADSTPEGSAKNSPVAGTPGKLDAEGMKKRSQRMRELGIKEDMQSNGSGGFAIVGYPMSPPKPSAQDSSEQSEDLE